MSMFFFHYWSELGVAKKSQQRWEIERLWKVAGEQPLSLGEEFRERGGIPGVV